MGLSQLVTEVTRPSHDDTDEGSITDLVFTNGPAWISSIDVSPAPVVSDHLAVDITLRSHRTAPRPSTVREFLDTRKGDFDHLRSLLHCIPWSAFMDPADADASLDIFMDLFDTAVRDSIPKKKKTQVARQRLLRTGNNIK